MAGRSYMNLASNWAMRQTMSWFQGTPETPITQGASQRALTLGVGTMVSRRQSRTRPPGFCGPL